MKDDPGEHLSNHEEEHDIDAQQSAEIPGWCINDVAVSKQNYRADEE